VNTLAVMGSGSVERPSPATAVASYLAGLAPGSRPTMTHALRDIARILLDTDERVDLGQIPWNELRYEHAMVVRARLQEKNSAATVNKKLSALRGVMRECFTLGLIDNEHYARVTSVPAVKGEVLMTGREVSKAELVKLFEVCREDETPAGRRDAAMLALLYGAGLRRSELVKLDWQSFDQATGRIVIQGAKGNKDREVWATNGSAEALLAWGVAVQLYCPLPPTGPLFTQLTRYGNFPGGSGVAVLRRLSTNAVRDMIVRRSRRAGVAPFTAHDLRRTFAGDLLDGGADLVSVQKLMGHANANTTARYDRRGSVVRRRASELLHVPFK